MNLLNVLPQSIDNTYAGQKAALWIFGLLIAMRILQSVNSIFNGYSIATSADGIPLQSYPPAASNTIVSLFALSAFSRLILVLLAALVLLRYRSLVPFMFALFLLEFLGRKAILRFLPIESGDAVPAFVLGLVFPALMIAGLALSLWPAVDQGAR